MTANNREIRIAHTALIVVAALGALVSVPLFLGPESPSDETGTENTVFALFAGLSVALVLTTIAITRTPFRDRHGNPMTDNELIAELEAQFEDEGPGHTI